MFYLNKEKGKDFKVLNITDPQLSFNDWAKENATLLRGTVSELVERVKPDLITISGDLSYAGSFVSYGNIRDLMESFNIPWTFIWGNHDNQKGYEMVLEQRTILTKGNNCLFEDGPKEIGNGNFTIAIKQDDKIIYGLIMMDSHDKVTYTSEDGEVKESWAPLLDGQFSWFDEQLDLLDGARVSTIFHIPFHAYKTAFKQAFSGVCSPKEVDYKDSANEKYWNEGYKSSIGVAYDEFGCYVYDDKAFEALTNKGKLDIVICGHDHTNNTIIDYKGVKLVYALKTGNGCYWDSRLNGGTVISINDDGAVSIHHEDVDPKKYL